MASFAASATASSPPIGRVERLFFMYLGSIIGVFVYFQLCGPIPYSAATVRTALFVGLGAHGTYMALAWRRGELKQFDFGLALLFALGALATAVHLSPALYLFEHYSPALVSVAFGLTALLPLLLQREPFTVYYARRQVPRWQQKTKEFGSINRVMTGYWVVLFFVAAGLAAWAPSDWRFTLLYPNLVIFGAGMIGGPWIPPLYLKLFPPGLPDSAEALIMGMPLAFNPRAAGDARATVQFRVGGTEPGDYYLRVDCGKCQSFEGIVPAADLTVHTPGEVWRGVVCGDVDGGHALAEGLFRAEGDLALLAKLSSWFKRS
jgi:hypothetical protein